MRYYRQQRVFSVLRCTIVISVAQITGLLTAAPQTESRQAFITQYCLGCHNQKSRVAGLSLENTAAENPSSHPELWERVVHKIDAAEMPPAGVPRPDKVVLKQFAAGLASELDAAARNTPYAGRPVVHRLNRLEYANAIRDLLAVDLPVAGELPPDGVAAGFDNIGDALSMSPLLLEQYLKVARRVSEVAVGVIDPSPVTENFPAPEGPASWLRAGLPFGTRGGIRVPFYFPHDGD